MSRTFLLQLAKFKNSRKKLMGRDHMTNKGVDGIATGDLI
jgi:hypothetical protein